MAASDEPPSSLEDLAATLTITGGLITPDGTSQEGNEVPIGEIAVGDGNKGSGPRASQTAATKKELQMESELRELKATLSAIVERQAEWESRGPPLEETFVMSDEHRFALQHRRYHDDSSDSDDDDYTRFDHRRRKMERILVGELKTLKREKDMIQNIRSLRRDRDSLLEKEREWEKERLRLEKLHGRQKGEEEADEEGHAAGEGESAGDEEGKDHSSAEPEQSEDAQAEAMKAPTIPKLHYAEWSTFKAIQALAEKDSYAIAVLKGEPVIAYDIASWAWWGKRSKRRRGKGDEAAATKASAKKKQPLVPGQAPLPERIRIHSRHIIRILEKICGDTLSSQLEPIVMVRPFKFLVYYEDQIRQKFQTLKMKFGEPTNDGAVSAIPAAADLGQAAAGGGDAETASQGGLENGARRPSMGGLKAQKQEEGVEDEDDKDETTTSATAYQQLSCLIEFMDTEIQQKLDYLASNSCERVSFTDIWYLFKPGDEVIEPGRKQAYRILEMTSVSHKVIPPWRNYYDKSSAKSEETPVRLHCVYIDFDGKRLGPVSKIFELPRFDGERAVTSLAVYPLRYAETSRDPEKSFRQKLIDRGKMFLDVAGIKHMHYNGLTLDARDEADSQVVVDFEEAFAAKGNGGWRPEVEELIGTSKLDSDDDELCAAECCREENVYKDNDAEKKRSQDYIAGLIPDDRSKDPSVTVYPRTLKDTKGPDNALIDEEFVIMSYRVFGFVLRSRKWAHLDLTYLSPIGTNQSNGGPGHSERVVPMEENQEMAFNQLVLPEGHKEMVLSLIAQHYRDKESTTADTEQVDIVRGKGKGLIILLHGAPGVGKTTTAEGVAELFKKPLFQITCGDLGTTASEVELALETNFALANRWGCILLLDEADVFLTARSPQDFVRNGLVAVFLRVLEYYAGILFLTTNRIGDFDEAFASRVHISLHYPQLDLESTLAIFKLNMNLIRQRFKKQGREIKIDEDAILQFAADYWTDNKKMRWNGRQIRNGCQTALALAEFKAQGGSHERIKDADAEIELHVRDLSTVSRAYLDFISYLKKLYGTDAEGRAKDIGIRARENIEAKASTPGKRSIVHEASVSSQGAATPQPQPSPTARPAYPQAPGPNVSQGGYPYQYLYPQQFPVPFNVPQAAATGAHQPPPSNYSPQTMPPGAWANPNAAGGGPWQANQQAAQGYGQHGGPVPVGWPAGPPPQGGPTDQQWPGGSGPPPQRNQG